MVQKMLSIINDHVTVSYQMKPCKSIFIQSHIALMFTGVNDTGNLKELFDEFCESFNNNIDYETAVEYFNNNTSTVKV